MTIQLCPLSELLDNNAKEFEVSGRKVIALREGEQVYVYLNLCPHLGTPLNWEPDSFLDEEGAYLRCSNHGALFVKQTGDCIAGPCRGMPLTSVPTSTVEGIVHIDLEPLKPYKPF